MKGVVVEQYWWGDMYTGSRQALFEARRWPAEYALPGDAGVPKRTRRVTLDGTPVATQPLLMERGGLKIVRVGRDRYEVAHFFDKMQLAARERYRELRKAAAKSRELIAALPCTEDQYRQRIERLLREGTARLIVNALDQFGGFSVKRDEAYAAVFAALDGLREALQEAEVEFDAAARGRQIDELRIRTHGPETDAQLQRLISDCMRGLEE